MGLAASQTRFLTLTARQSDLEYQAQQISNTRLQLSKQMEQIATDYTNSLSTRNLFSTDIHPSVYQQINTTNLAISGYEVLVVAKNMKFSEYIDPSYIPPAGEIKKSLEDGIRDGTYVLLRKANPFSQSVLTNAGFGTPTDPHTGWTGNYEAVDWRAMSEVYDDLFTADDGKAQDIYDRKVAQANQKDKSLTLQMSQIETEHKAIESEIEAVKKVIDKNTEMSFKTFA
ncbi:MAG: hypothetical protein WCF95_02680 [bacterium]